MAEDRFDIKQLEKAADEIMDFLDFLKTDETTKVSWSTRKNAFAAIRKLYVANRVKLDWDYIRDQRMKKTPEEKEEESDSSGRGYRLDEIKKILGASSGIRDRAIVLLLASAGFRIEVIAKLKRRHLVNMKDFGHPDIYRIGPIYSKSRMVHSYCSPEAFHAINDYLNERETGDGKYREIVKPENPLFAHGINRRRWKDPKSELNRIDRIEHPKPLKHGSAKGLLEHAVKTSGIIESKANQDNKRIHQKRNKTPRNHGLRKWFNTACRNLKPAMDQDIRMLIMGHDTKLQKSYYDDLDDHPESQQKIIDEYVRVVPSVTIDKSKVWEATAIEAVKEKKEVEVQASVDRGHLHDDYRHELKEKDSKYERLEKKWEKALDYINKHDAKTIEYKPQLEDKEERKRQLKAEQERINAELAELG